MDELKPYRCPVCNAADAKIQDKLDRYAAMVEMMDEKIQFMELLLESYRKRMAEVTAKANKAENKLALHLIEEHKDENPVQR